jgi:anti-sigma factor RsiW
VWPGVAVGVIAVLALAPAWPGPSMQEDGGVFVEDYLRRAVGQHHLITSDPDEVRRFLVRELGIEVSPLRTSGLELQRVEICLLEGRRGAMIVYAKGDASVSHYVVPRSDTQPRQPTLSKPTDPVLSGSLPVVTWSTEALEQALVGDLASGELLEIARDETLQ